MTMAIKLIRGMAEVYPNFQAQNKTTQVKYIDRQNRLSVFICTCLSSVNCDAPIVWFGPILKQGKLEEKYTSWDYITYHIEL